MKIFLYQVLLLGIITFYVQFSMTVHLIFFCAEAMSGQEDGVCMLRMYQDHCGFAMPSPLLKLVTSVSVQ